MHVPVLLTRHVFWNVVPAAISALSGMVTSATNAALLVQLGSLGGRVACAVGVELISGRGVIRVSVGMRVSVAGAEVSVGACVCVAVGASVAARALQEESSNVISVVTVNSFLIISNSFAWMPDSALDQCVWSEKVTVTFPANLPGQLLHQVTVTRLYTITKTSSSEPVIFQADRW
jgi:hypothetical protein